MNQNQLLTYKNRLNLARWCLRLGLATVFAYASFEAFFVPANFLKYIPSFVVQAVDPRYFLPAFGTVEIILVICLALGYKVRLAAIFSFFLMAAIVTFNPAYFSILFRNIAIGFAALALALLEEVKAIFIN